MKKIGWIGALSLLLTISGIKAGSRNAYPLPEDRGAAGVSAALKKLPVYVRVLEITAHPDDESAATLTWLSRVYHAQTALFSLTRGEGGQNILGPEKYEALGLLRTGELLEACKYYGTELFFGKAVDFGFSKSSEESLSKWGRQETLGDLVHFIRRWRPTIIISRFQGNAADGHGHHQAAGILSREAFIAAADPNKFPEQLNGDIQPWRAKRLLVSNMTQGGTGTIRTPVGDYDPILGLSPREISTEGYSKHRSQGNGAASSLPGKAYEYFKPADGSPAIQNKEGDFFNSMDTSVKSILDLAGDEKNASPSLLKLLAEVNDVALDAIHPERQKHAVLIGISLLTKAIEDIEKSNFSQSTKALVLEALRSKLQDFQNAANAICGIYIQARVDDATGTPGEKESVNVYFYNRGTEPVKLKGIKLSTASGAIAPASANPQTGELPAGGSAIFKYSDSIGPDAKPTEQFWRLSPDGRARYSTAPTQNEFAPFGEPEMSAEAVYTIGDIAIPIRTTVQAQTGNPLRGPDFDEFQIVPALSLMLDPDLKIVPVSSKNEEYEFRVSILNNKKDGARGTLKLTAGSGWRIKPEEFQFALSRKGETYSASFTVQVPAGAKVGDYSVEAIATMAGQDFRRGYQTISYPDNWTRNFYRPAKSKLEVFEIKTPPNLTVGYIPGAGDEIPAALQQLGINVQTISPSYLAFGDLDHYSTIITGIRAYNVNEDLKANNKRLLDYVNRGGTLIVQYVRPERGASSFPFGPYPMTVSDSDRITVEDSPVKILDPSNPIFNQPNKITESDFQGWVQERGLYFMNSWDPQYKALLSGNDPGEDPKNGGMLITQYGKGTYIYTGYSWFRQLPAGVPGAFRIFANMLSLKRN
jgi:LmbE family N-acetylglucosaminyl deacetylase